MSYDPGKEDEKLEARLLREMDRRFSGIERQMEELEKQLQELDDKVASNFKEIAQSKRETYIWLVRMVITAIVSTIVGAGALGFVEQIMKVFRP